jgi:preprotein translocase subunit Sec63
MTPKSDLDPYTVLGVARTASEAEIRAAYLELIAKYHPDRHQGNPLEDLAAVKVAEINWAYEILSDPARRAAYDSGQLRWPHSPFATAAGGARRRSHWPLIVGILLLVPLLLRFGSFFVRLLARLYRVVAEGLAVVRGTPAALVAMAVALVVLVLLVLRSRRRRRPSHSGPGN